jgi:hypothetical protein
MIELGDKVVDRVTGLEGVALARITGLYEATQLRVHPVTLKDGDVRAFAWIEEARCERVSGERLMGFVGVQGNHEISR